MADKTHCDYYLAEASLLDKAVEQNLTKYWVSLARVYAAAKRFLDCAEYRRFLRQRGEAESSAKHLIGILKNPHLTSEFIERHRDLRRSQLIEISREKGRHMHKYVEYGMSIPAIRAERKQHKQTPWPIQTFGANDIYHVDAIQACNLIPDDSLDLIIADPPTSENPACHDIDPAWFWSTTRRILKPHGVVLMLFADGAVAGCRFISAIKQQNKACHVRQLTYRKTQPTRFYDCWRAPLKECQNVLVFSDSKSTYIPEMRPGKPYTRKDRSPSTTSNYGEGTFITTTVNHGTRHPTDYLGIYGRQKDHFHPQQKSVDLYATLIKSYSRPNELVFDPFSGSGTTGIACIQTGRRFILFERDRERYLRAKARIEKALTSLLRDHATVRGWNAEPESMQKFPCDSGQRYDPRLS